MKNLNNRYKVNELRITWEVHDKKLNKKETLSFNHSNHSLTRSKQRNINNQNISDAIEYGTAFFKQGLVYYVLGEHHLPDSLIKKNSKNIIVIIAGNSSTILTCYRSNNPFKYIKNKQKHLETRYPYAA